MKLVLATSETDEYEDEEEEDEEEPYRAESA